MKVLIADDHSLFRKGFRQALASLQSDIDISEANSFQAVSQILEKDSVDLVFLDLLMPGMNGFENIKKISETFPGTRIVVVSALEDANDIQQAFHHGASGYLPKTLVSEVMMNALRLVLAGGTYLPPKVLNKKEKTAAPKGALPENLDDSLTQLTPRQREVFALLGEGKSNRDIAGELGLSVSTVKIYVTGVLKALNISNRTQAGILASKENAASKRNGAKRAGNGL